WFSGFLNDRLLFERYLLYNEFLVIGILFAGGKRQEVLGPHREWVLANRQSWRQLLAGLFCVFMVVIALKDRTISRSFLLSFTPLLYMTLLFSNYWLPPALGQWAFSGDREERVALAGTVEQAARLKPWLERRNLIGLRTVGIICPAGARTDSAPFPVLG